MEQTNENTQGQKPKISKLAVVSPLVVILSFLLLVAWAFLFYLVGEKIYMMLYLSILAFLLSPLISLIFAIVSAWKIYKSKGALKGYLFSILGTALGLITILSFILLIIFIPALGFPGVHSEALCETKPAGTGKTTQPYHTDAAEKLIREGHDKRHKKNYQGAIALYTEAIKLKPDAYMYYGYRGGAYLIIKEYDKAIDDFSKQIELDANIFKGYQNRARAYFEKKDYDNAINDFNKLIDFKHGYFAPGFLNATTFRELADCYAAKGNYNKALECCDKAIEMVDKFPREAGRGNFKRAVIYEQMGNYDRALADYTEAIKLNAAKQGRDDPYAGGPCHDSDFDFTQADYFYARGALYQKKGDTDNALEDFNQAITHNKLHPKAYKNRALIYLSRSEIKKSLADKAKAESLGETFDEEFDKISSLEPQKQELPAEKSQKLSDAQVEEALFKYFAAKKKETGSPYITFSRIKDITNDELYKTMGLQIFNFHTTGPFFGDVVLSLAAKDRQHKFFIANSGLIGEMGVTSYCVADMDKDGKPELFFTHSGGSGIYRTMIDMLRWDDTGYVVGEVAVIYDLSIVIKKVDDQNIEFGEPTSWLYMLGNRAGKNQKIKKMGVLQLRDGKYYLDFTEDASQKLRPHYKESYKEGVVWSPKQVELLD